MNIKDLEAQAKYLAPVIKAAMEKVKAEILAELKAPDPVPGPEGPQGPAGKDADPEAVKAAVLDSIELPQPDIEAIKAAVLAEIDIPEPEPARHGQDGRDALDLEVLPEIDSAKSYARGSYATHNGGLWRAYERTHGMRGWECIVDGVADVTVEQTSERGFKVVSTRASGATVSKDVTIPSTIYREVYSAGTEYEKGDAVTYNGSLWIALKDAPTGAPGAGKAEDTGWRLAVKSGRNGKDLRDNASKHDSSKGLKI